MTKIKGEILFFNHEVNFRLKNKKLLKLWIADCIKARGFSTGFLNFIFCTDDYLLEINKKHLHHDYYTDIITFPLSEIQLSKVIDAELYISVDRIKENASNLNCSFTDELHRVMIHGVLHLCGLKDKTKNELLKMRSSEDEELFKLKNKFSIQ